MARINNLENFLQDVADAIKEKKEYQSSQKIAAENFDTEISSISTLKGETVTITPSVVQQTINPSTGKNAITQAIVNAVTASIDANITANNIRKDVTILGITGTLQPDEPIVLTLPQVSVNPVPYIKSFTKVNNAYVGQRPLIYEETLRDVFGANLFVIMKEQGTITINVTGSSNGDTGLKLVAGIPNSNKELPFVSGVGKNDPDVYEAKGNQYISGAYETTHSITYTLEPGIYTIQVQTDNGNGYTWSSSATYNNISFTIPETTVNCNFLGIGNTSSFNNPTIGDIVLTQSESNFDVYIYTGSDWLNCGGLSKITKDTVITTDTNNLLNVCESLLDDYKNHLGNVYLQKYFSGDSATDKNWQYHTIVYDDIENKFIDCSDLYVYRLSNEWGYKGIVVWSKDTDLYGQHTYYDYLGGRLSKIGNGYPSDNLKCLIYMSTNNEYYYIDDGYASGSGVCNYKTTQKRNIPGTIDYVMYNSATSQYDLHRTVHVNYWFANDEGYERIINGTVTTYEGDCYSDTGANVYIYSFTPDTNE